jgi:DNA-binding FadR family transcriptional regulator
MDEFGVVMPSVDVDETKPKRAQAIVRDYLRQIVEGTLNAGDALPTESALVASYGSSRTVVREAIQTLVAKGLVLVKQGSGASVAPRANWNVLDPEYLKMTGLDAALLDDLLESRDIIEPAVAALAATRATDVQIEVLRQFVADMRAAATTDPQGHAELDLGFHTLLAECTNNVVLVSIHASITHLGRAQREMMARREGGIERAVFWHQHIVDAIQRRDPEASRDAMRMHLRQVHGELDSPREA